MVELRAVQAHAPPLLRPRCGLSPWQPPSELRVQRAGQEAVEDPQDPPSQQHRFEDVWSPRPSPSHHDGQALGLHLRLRVAVLVYPHQHQWAWTRPRWLPLWYRSEQGISLVLWWPHLVIAFRIYLWPVSNVPHLSVIQSSTFYTLYVHKKFDHQNVALFNVIIWFERTVYS